MNKTPSHNGAILYVGGMDWVGSAGGVRCRAKNNNDLLSVFRFTFKLETCVPPTCDTKMKLIMYPSENPELCENGKTSENGQCCEPSKPANQFM